MANTFLTLRQRLRLAIGDGHREVLTTALTTDKNVVSTNLQKWDGGSNNWHLDTFVYVEDYVNAGENRVTSTYTSSSGTFAVRGANFSSDSANKATCMFTVYNPDDYEQAIKQAIRKLDLTLFVSLDDITLITGNILPDGHFEDWTSSTALRFGTASNATLAQTTTAGLIWGSVNSVQVTATADNGYVAFTSDKYPRLLDLMGKTVTFKSFAYPQVADEATLVIYTKQADGTEQTLTSTTSNPAGEWTLLELEDQDLNDNLVDIQFRYKVATDTKYAYFDNSRVTGLSIYEFMLPVDFRDGHLSQAFIQTGGLADDPCDDLHLYKPPEKIYFTNDPVADDGTYKYLRLPALYPNSRKIELIGYKPLTVPSSDSDSVEVNDPELELLIAQSALELYNIMRGPISTQATSKFAIEIAYWEREVFRLMPRFRGHRPIETVRTR